VCAGPRVFFDRATVLRKYEVDFYRCTTCGLIALPEPTWLDEAYTSAIYDGDSGLLRRSRRMTNMSTALIRSERLSSGTILDWAGGYGAFTRMMRDKGLDCFTFDPYAQNLLAPGFDGDEFSKYDLVTAFEVMEHIGDPVSELEKVTSINDRFFFTTQLQPPTPPRPSEWFYYALESGQHIAFHTLDSLQIVAERLGYQLTSNGDNYHLFHRVPLRSTTKVMLSPKIGRASRSAVATARSTATRLKSRRA
jgi:hypothetical protein